MPRLIDFVQANEPRLIAFNEYANEDGTEVAVVQVHPDADSMAFHMEVIAERAAGAYAERRSMQRRVSRCSAHRAGLSSRCCDTRPALAYPSASSPTISAASRAERDNAPRMRRVQPSRSPETAGCVVSAPEADPKVDIAAITVAADDVSVIPPSGQPQPPDRAQPRKIHAPRTPGGSAGRSRGRCPRRRASHCRRSVRGRGSGPH